VAPRHYQYGKSKEAIRQDAPGTGRETPEGKRHSAGRAAYPHPVRRFRKKANVLAQLRTAMARLSGYLHRIGVVGSDQCAYGQARETVEHFLFNCLLWEMYRERLLEQTETRRGSLSYCLGGKALFDPRSWTPNTEAVRTSIKYAIATGRLDREVEQTATQTSQQ
jgi:hypothetical protein